MMDRLTPSSLMISEGVTQLVPARSRFCCSAKPVEGEGQEIKTVLVGVTTMLKAGAPGVETA